MAQHCQLILNQARSLVQTQLTRIAQLDQLVELKTYQSSGRKVELIDLLKHRKQHNFPPKETTANRNKLVEAIDLLDDEIEHLSEEKIRLANSLYCSVAAACEEVEEVMASCSGLHLGEAGKQSQEETNWQLSNLIAECRIQQNQDFCICSPQQRMTVKPQDRMIFCQGESCAKRWFHQKCVNLDEKNMPEVWFCNLCNLESVNQEINE